MWQTRDPNGRTVILTAERWAHIVARRGAVQFERREVLAAVRQPSRWIWGRRAGEEFFYLEAVGPSRWIKVVVHYADGRGRIVTAFPRRRFP